MPAKILLYTTAVVILTIGMRELASVLTTIFFSIFATLIFIPLIRWLRRKGVPGGVSVVLVILAFVIIIIGIGILVVQAAIQIGGQLPDYNVQLTTIINRLSQDIPTIDPTSLQSFVQKAATSLLGFTASLLNAIVNGGTTVGLIIVTTAFLLIDAASSQGERAKQAAEQSVLGARVGEFGKGLVGFIVIRTETNLVTAIGVTIFLLLGGIDYALFWGVLIFLLSYVPYVGLFLATIPPALLALFKYGPAGAVAVILVISVVNVLAENVVFPSLAGKGLKLSPAVVFISLLYWGYVLGAAGVLLSTPLAVVVKIILDSFEETKWLSRLMSGSTENREHEEATGE